jgi:hypothetical protein
MLGNSQKRNVNVLPTAGVVPYITTWSEEQTLSTKVVTSSGIGIRFADEGDLNR